MNSPPNPFQHSGDDTLVLDGVRLPVSGRCVRLRLRGNRISALEDSPVPPQWLSLPPLVDKHVHACRAYSRPDASQPCSLDDGIRRMHAILAASTSENFRERSLRLFRRALAMGSTGLRTHTDVGAAVGLRAVRGTVAAREQVGTDMRIEIVAFAGADADPAEAGVRAQLRAALSEGAGLLGAAPNFYPDPERSIDALLQLAVEEDVDVDVHLDEHLDPGAMLVDKLARAVLRHGYSGRVTIGHCCVLSVLGERQRREVIAALAKAGITVIALPHTNLYLQDRDSLPNRRGLTAVVDLIRAGVPLRIASDNVHDPVYPYGSADLLEAAWLASIIGQYADAAASVAAVCDGRTELQAGDPADLVLIAAADLDTALAERDRRRLVVIGERLLA
jgi:cytosine deaminase